MPRISPNDVGAKGTCLGLSAIQQAAQLTVITVIEEAEFLADESVAVVAFQAALPGNSVSGFGTPTQRCVLSSGSHETVSLAELPARTVQSGDQAEGQVPLGNETQVGRDEDLRPVWCDDDGRLEQEWTTACDSP